MHYELLLEGGGTRTWAGCYSDQWLSQVSTGSTNGHSVGTDVARRRLRQLMSVVLERAGVGSDCRGVTAAHGAAGSTGAARDLHDEIRDVLRDLSIDAPILVANDIVALLTVVPTRDAVAVVAGTGTGYAARHGWHRWARASGLEYLLSDEGGGFDVGLAGLRAVIRATDCRGPRTDLLRRASQWTDCDSADIREVLPHKVYGADHKLVIADFAREVLASADAGDSVASAIAQHAAEEIVAGAVAVASAADCSPDDLAIVLSGSLFRSASLAVPVRIGLTEKLGPGQVRTVAGADLPEVVRTMASTLAGVPAWLDALAAHLPVAWSRP